MRFSAILAVVLLPLFLPSCVIQMGESESSSAVSQPSGAHAQPADQPVSARGGESVAPVANPKAVASAQPLSAPRVGESGSPATQGRASPAEVQGDAYLGVQLSFHLFDMQEDHLFDMQEERTNVDRTVAFSADYYEPIDDAFAVGVLGGLSRSDVVQEDRFFGSIFIYDATVTRLFAGPGFRWSPDLGGGLRPFAGIGMGFEIAASDGKDFISDETSLGLFFRPSAGLRFETGADIAFDLGVTMHYSEPFDNEGFGNDESEAMLTLGFAIKL